MFPIDSGLRWQRPTIGRKGGKNNEDSEISFIGSVSDWSYGSSIASAAGAEGVISKDALTEVATAT